MLTGKLLAIFFSLLILANALVMRRIVGTWLFPAVLFALAWFAFTFIPLVALFVIPVNPWATAYITGGTLLFSASSLVYFDWKAALERNRMKPDPVSYFNTPLLQAIFAACAFIAVVGFFVNMLLQGFTFQSMINEALVTAGTYADLGYSGELRVNIYSRIGVTAAYLAVCLGGLLFGTARSTRQRIATILGGFTPAVLEMLLHSQKGYLFGFISLFFGGVLVTRIFADRHYLIDKTNLRVAAGALLVIIPMVVMALLARGLTRDVDPEVARAVIFHNLRSYAFGHMYAFSDWFTFRTGGPTEIRYAVEPTGYGFYTFMAIFKALGSTREVPLGMFDEYYAYADLIRTNIFTIFRGFIIDFGFLGTYLYLFLCGFLLHLSYYLMLMKRKPAFTVSVFVLMIAFFYMTYIFSLLGWNTIPATALSLGGCLWINGRRLNGHSAGITAPGPAPQATSP